MRYDMNIKKRIFSLGKKAVINISIRWIVLTIITLVVLLSILGLIRLVSKEADVNLDEGVSRYVNAPTAVISSPQPWETYKVFEHITFDGSRSFDKNYRIEGYFWDKESDLNIESIEKEYSDYYFEPGEYNLTLKVVNKMGAIGSTSQFVRIVTNNKKSSDLDNSIFLIRDNDRANEQNILRLIPVTTWYDADGFHQIPFYVYYVKNPVLSLEQAKLDELMLKHGRNHIYSFSTILAKRNSVIFYTKLAHTF